MKIIISGGREFNDYQLLREKCNFYLSNQSNVEIVSGRCDTGTLTFVTDEGIRVFGADGHGERWAKEKGYPVTPFPADWNKGKIAGPIRNEQMAKYADALVCFWDGKSRGTYNMIKVATKEGLKVKVVRY